MKEPSTVYEGCRKEKGVGHRGAPSALMLSFLSAGPSNHATSKWDQISSYLWGMPAEWGV